MEGGQKVSKHKRRITIDLATIQTENTFIWAWTAAKYTSKSKMRREITCYAWASHYFNLSDLNTKQI